MLAKVRFLADLLSLEKKESFPGAVFLDGVKIENILST